MKATETSAKKVLESQQYRFVGRSTAVKICRWTKNSIRDDGSCYKQQFYGIESHRCVQMSPSVGYCQNRCVFCWRPIELTLGSKMVKYDEPADVIDQCIKEQQSLLSGFGGNEKANTQKLAEAKKPRHFAISLSGEPLLYPKLSTLIKLLRKQGYSTFVVTNGLEPQRLMRLASPTQLYLSVDAPDERLFHKIDQSVYKDGWLRLLRSLDVIRARKGRTRTCLRFTLIKGLNMVKPKEWAALIEKAQPWYVEVKAYMHVGFSKKRLSMENMPLHSEVVAFAEKIAHHSSYKIIDEHPRSRVVLMARDKADRRMIDFGKDLISPARTVDDMESKMAILVRDDLKLPKGKMASQAAHAAVEAVMRSSDSAVSAWRGQGSKKVVLKVKDLDELQRSVNLAKSEKLVASVITDAGRTVIEPGTVTCAAIGPAEEERIDKVVGKLKLM
jgi:tRNA wybutosine-synthesizing protein 1